MTAVLDNKTGTLMTGTQRVQHFYDQLIVLLRSMSEVARVVLKAYSEGSPKLL